MANERKSDLGPDDLMMDDQTQWQMPMTSDGKAVRPFFESDGSARVVLGGPTPSEVVIKANTESDGSGSNLYLRADSNGYLRAVINTDIQIGAVEIKDFSTGRRVNVKSDGTNNALIVRQNTQPLPSGAAIESGGNLQNILSSQATQAQQSIANVTLSSIAVSTRNKALESGGNLQTLVSSSATKARQSIANVQLGSIAVNGRNKVLESGGNVQTLVSSNATKALQVTGNDHLSSIAVNTRGGIAKESGGNLQTLVSSNATKARQSIANVTLGSIAVNTRNKALESGGNLQTLVSSNATKARQSIANVVLGSIAVNGRNKALESGGHLQDIDSEQTKVATSFAVANILMNASDSEYSHAFAANTKKFTLKLRDASIDLKISDEAASSATKFFTMPSGIGMSEDNLDVSGKKLYFQTDTDSQAAEVIEWT